MITANTITRPQLELLVGLVERGPFPNYEITNVAILDDLLNAELAVRICGNGIANFTAATHLGRNVYCTRFGGLDLDEAKSKRLSLVRAA